MHCGDRGPITFSIADFFISRRIQISISSWEMLNFRATFALIKTQIGTKIKIWLATMFGEAVVYLGRREVFDRETVRQFRVSLGWVLSDNFRVGQLPASRLSVQSDR